MSSRQPLHKLLGLRFHVVLEGLRFLFGDAIAAVFRNSSLARMPDHRAVCHNESRGPLHECEAGALNSKGMKCDFTDTPAGRRHRRGFHDRPIAVAL